nr:hypothetical protein [uncultured Agathobaculum sp.]
MKKLVIICSAVLALGLCMMAGGWAAGGQLYGMYYNGALHPVSDGIRDASRVLKGIGAGFVEHVLESDSLDALIDETVNSAIDGTLYGFDTDWVDGWLDSRQQAIDAPLIPAQHIDEIHSLDFTLSGGDIAIEAGSDFDLSGDFTVSRSECDGNTWALTLTAGRNGAAITLPDSVGSYREVSLTVADAAVTANNPLLCNEMDITVAAGSLDADLLGAQTMDLTVGAGAVHAQLDGAADTYYIQGKAAMGSILFNGEQLAGGVLGTHRFNNRNAAIDTSRELYLEVGAGSVELHTIQ